MEIRIGCEIEAVNKIKLERWMLQVKIIRRVILWPNVIISYLENISNFILLIITNLYSLNEQDINNIFAFMLLHHSFCYRPNKWAACLTHRASYSRGRL